MSRINEHIGCNTEELTMNQNINQKSEIRNPNLFSISNFLFRACLGFLISYFVFGGTQPVKAQEVSLAVSPPVVEILLAPNKKVSQAFTLKIQGENLAITPELHLATPSDSDGHMMIDPKPLNPNSLPLTAIITSPTIHDPRSTIYNITFEAANTDVSQDVYLALVFRASPPSTIYDLRSTITSPLARQSLGVGGAISSLILITITPAGVIPIDLSLKNWDLPFFHDSYLPLTLTPELTNNTSVMIRPQGDFTVISPTGKTIFSLPLYPNLILGNSSRIIQSTIHDLPSTISWSPTWSDLGPYRLRLTLTTEGGTQITQGEKVIWIIPLRLLLILSILITLILGLTRRKKNTTLDID